MHPDTPNVRCALFDIDGTLVDTVEAIVRALHDTFSKHLQLNISREVIQHSIGLPLKTQMRMFDTHVSFSPDHQAMEDDMIFAYDRYRHLETLFSEAVQTLDVAKQAGMSVGLVTSKNAQECAEFLPRMRVAENADTVVCSSDTKNPKPHPDPILEAMKRLNASPEETIYVGDATYDIEAGHRAGVRVAAVCWGAHTQEMLSEKSPEWLFQSPNELLSFFEQLAETR